jgi:flavin reductase
MPTQDHPAPPGGPASARPDPALFRDGMSRVAGAVHVVATDGPAGRSGFTATAMTPVTESPPTLLVCVNTEGRSAAAVVANGVFCVNTLAAEDVAIADCFAGRAGLVGPERFRVGAWERLVTGAPALSTSLVSFDCRLVDERLVSTHHVMMGEILAIRFGAPRPGLVYVGRGYREL